MPTTAPRYKQQGARAPGPKPPGCAQARTRGGRLAWVLGRNAKGWIAVELDGNASDEGKAYDLLCFPNERHSPRSEKDRAFMEARVFAFLDTWLRQ